MWSNFPYLPLDELRFITRQYVNPEVSRSGIAHLLKREGMSCLKGVIPKAEGEAIAPKKQGAQLELQEVLNRPRGR